jgi:hypothetical protein
MGMSSFMSDPFSLVFLGGGILLFGAFGVIFTLAAMGLLGNRKGGAKKSR